MGALFPPMLFVHDKRDTVADFTEARAKYRELKKRLGAASVSLDLDKQVEMAAWDCEDQLYRHYIGGRNFNGPRVNAKLTSLIAEFVTKHVRLG